MLATSREKQTNNMMGENTNFPTKQNPKLGFALEPEAECLDFICLTTNRVGKKGEKKLCICM